MRWIAFVMTCALATGTAAAQEADTDDVARRAFEAGREAFASGDYDTALIRFREAYELSPRPGLLYNIAQSLDRLRRDEEALATLRQYLEAVPTTRSRAEVEARIRVLERTLAEREAAVPTPQPEPAIAPAPEVPIEAPPEPDPVAPSSTRPPLHPALFLATAGLALAGGGVAVWTGLETLDRRDAYLASTNLAEARDHYDGASTFQTTTNVLIFSSAGLAAVAVVMLFFTDWGGEPDALAWMPSIQLGLDGGTVGALGRF